MKNDGVVKIVIAVVLVFIVAKTCSTSKRTRQIRNTSISENWQKNPVDELIKSYSDVANFSIILYDMDVENPNSMSPEYKHKYRIVRDVNDSVMASETDWNIVSSSFFQQHVDNMGMEIASKKDGVVEKETAPAGYNNYVGNEKYGRWENRGGSSFWSFYGRYAFMSSMFNMMSPVRRSYYNDYRGNYYGSGRTYYGPSGQRIYGTKSYTSSASGKNTSWASKPNNFKSKVRSSVSRSSSASKSRSYSSSSSYNNKTTRSTSRSSSNTSYRSRSGGYGK